MSLSDGMGSGEQAARESQRVIELAEQLLEAGYTARATFKAGEYGAAFGRKRAASGSGRHYLHRFAHGGAGGHEAGRGGFVCGGERRRGAFGGGRCAHRDLKSHRAGAAVQKAVG